MSLHVHPQSINAAYRLRVRLELPAGDKALDISIPSRMSLAEVLEELLALLEAPAIDSPWSISTALGTELDYSVPLAQLPIGQGSTIVLRPYQLAPHPVLVDAAESLADLPTTSRIQGLSLALFLACSVGIMVIAPFAPAAVVLALVSFGVAAWSRAAGSVFGAAGSIFLGLSTSSFLTMAGFSWALAGCGGSVLALATLPIGLIRAPRILAGCGTIFVILLLSCGLSLLLPSLWAFGSALSLIGLVALMVGPQACATLSGLKVPRLPSAGEELTTPEPRSFSDEASCALELHEGSTIGACICIAAGMLIPSFMCLWLGLSSPRFVFGAMIAVAGACALHCVRMRTTPSAWALWLVLIAMVLSWAMVASNQDIAHWSAILPLVVFVLLLSGPVVAYWLADAAPTTIVWIERMESLCVAFALPMLCYSMGLFHFVRGLL
ncbi:MAG: type VII secretion integral membrane protein EccD [Corynebacterium sp.]|nr:type VII secretion integral membrane protein EccD [Corynebacterium sp.]